MDDSATSVNSADKPITQPSINNSHPMWDAFEHILLFISLYVFATSFTLLLHNFVDRWSPGTDYSSSYSYVDDFTNTLVRGLLAAIIVSYPFFALLFLRITGRTLDNPNLRKIKARKTLIYFTLVVTFIISLGNFISIVFNLLGGNVTLNFLLHFTVTFSVSGIIFLYYLKQVKEDRLINA